MAKLAGDDARRHQFLIVGWLADRRIGRLEEERRRRDKGAK